MVTVVVAEPVAGTANDAGLIAVIVGPVTVRPVVAVVFPPSALVTVAA
jgi:hypothetical protein